MMGRGEDSGAKRRSAARSGRELALEMLARRDHGQEELRRRLRDRGVGDDEIESVVGYLSAAGYLDDGRIVETEVARLVRAVWGPLKIRRYLLEKGFAEHLVEASLLQVAGEEPDDFWRRLAERALQARRPQAGTAWGERERARHYRFLIARGFPESLARALVRP
ncbi:MAG: RecX family transcriptional regulator [Candidatus Schekmanbacteria bacterium]|nr:RecX family transcriptional regulator [Candidatus Schekmanbacteria bacterium]